MEHDGGECEKKKIYVYVTGSLCCTVENWQCCKPAIMKKKNHLKKNSKKKKKNGEQSSGYQWGNRRYSIKVED